jgi:CRISPR-associated protein Cmr4
MPTRFVQFFHCLTPVHNGAGQGLGTLDRPIIREKTTDYPFIQSSTLKGAFKAAACPKNGGTWLQGDCEFAFGKGETDGNQGALLFGDASILFFPVRSLIGTLAWVTSSLALARFIRALQLCGNGAGANATDLETALTTVLQALPLDQGAALVPESKNADSQAVKSLLLKDGKAYLEGLVLTARTKEDANAAASNLWTAATAIAGIVFGTGQAQGEKDQKNDPCATAIAKPASYWKDFFVPRVLLISDADFRHLVLHATQQEANITIEPTGVTKDGSLRYTEYLPTESILFSLISFDPPDKTKGNGATILSNYKQLVQAPIQLGADESKGKGLVQSSVL